MISLAGYTRIAVDTETNGLDWHARPVGISWAVHPVVGEMVSGYERWGHPMGNNCDLETARRWWKAEIDREGVTIVMHNAPFDMKMLAYAGFEIKHARVEDTGLVSALLFEYEPSYSLGALTKKYTKMVKADERLHQWMVEHLQQVKQPTRSQCAPHYWRVPGNIIEEYACGDAECTLALYEKRRPVIDEQELGRLYEVETGLLPILHRMHMVGIPVDVDRAADVRQSLAVDYKKLAAQWQELAGDANMRSGKDLQRLFDANGIPYPLTEKGNPSFAKETLETLSDSHVLPGLILGLRRLATLQGTFLDSYILKQAVDGVIHCNFNSYLDDRAGTVSGRFSSDHPNLQNIPARDEVWAPIIRGLFVPLPGRRMLKADYSQIEYRFFAHYAGGNLRAAYVDDPDIDFHAMVAELCDMLRKPAKNINFANLYGAGVGKIAIMLGLDVDEAQPIVDEYHRRVPEVASTNKQVVGIATKRGYIRSWGGRRHRFPRHLRQKNRKAQPWKALNRLCQGSAADLIKYAMLGVSEAIDWDGTVMHLTVHDELVLSTPEGEEGVRAAARIREVMEDTTSMHAPMGDVSVPVKVDLGTGPDWGHCKEKI